MPVGAGQVGPGISNPSTGGGGGAVSSVTANNTSVVVSPTTGAVLVNTNTLDVIATQEPPAGNWSNNSHKITSLANGSASSDAAAFGQIPTSSASLLMGNVTAQSTTYSANSGDIVLATAGAGGFTVTLPAPTLGDWVIVKKVDSGAGTVTVAHHSAETIDGANSVALIVQYDAVWVVSNGTNWYVPDPFVGNLSQESIIRTNTLNQMGTPTANLAMGSNQITGLADGTTATAAATVQQIPTVTTLTASSGTFTPTISGIYEITCIGSGGSGGGGANGGSSTSVVATGGAGGGAGGIAQGIQTLVGGTGYSYSIGASVSGGAGGTAGASASAGTGGNSGNSTTFTGTAAVTATGGGQGGGGATTSATNNIQGGSSGVAGTGPLSSLNNPAVPGGGGTANITTFLSAVAGTANGLVAGGGGGGNSGATSHGGGQGGAGVQGVGGTAGTNANQGTGAGQTGASAAANTGCGGGGGGGANNSLAGGTGGASGSGVIFIRGPLGPTS